MQRLRLFLGWLRLFMGCQAWLLWQPDSPAITACASATPIRDHRKQRKR